MFERFTKPARNVVRQAMDVATETGASQVRPEHLLVALVQDEDNLAVRVLGDLGAGGGPTRRPRLR